jgi:GNAT superfamily N-acetyltransferase
MTVLIRRATPRDCERAITIVFDALHSYGIEPEPHGLDASVLRFGTAEGGAYEVVADIDGQVAGVAVLGLRDKGKGEGETEGWVSKVFVDASLRRRGAGKALMADVVREARARGWKRLGLQTRAIFREAIALYEATGWKRGPSPASGPCDRTYTLCLD